MLYVGMIVNGRRNNPIRPAGGFSGPGAGTWNGSGSGPGGEDRFGFHDLFGRTGEGEFKFSGALGDENLDGVQSLDLHGQAQLLVDFLETVLLEAIAHDAVSVGRRDIATYYAMYLVVDGKT